MPGNVHKLYNKCYKFAAYLQQLSYLKKNSVGFELFALAAQLPADILAIEINNKYSKN